MTTVHEIRIEARAADAMERAYWECSCGRSGSCAAFYIDIASDSHIDYGAGDSRVDTTRSLD